MLVRTLAPLVLLLSAPALAQDSGQPNDLQKLLDSIPTIETKAPPPVEAPKVEEQGMDLPTYVAEVQKTILANWQPSPKLVEKHPTLTAQLLVKINEDGTIADVVAVQLSGNKKFDKSAVAAVFATPSVTVPTISLRATAQSGVLVNFVAAAKRGK